MIKCGGFFNVEKQAWIFKNCPSGGYTLADMRDAGFGGWLKQLLPFATKMAKLDLTPEEHAVLCAICIITPGKVASPLKSTYPLWKINKHIFHRGSKNFKCMSPLDTFT